MRGEGRIAALLAATVILAAFSEAAAAPHGQQLTEGISGALGTAGGAEEHLAPQRSAAGRRYSAAPYHIAAPYQGHRVTRRRLAQNTAASSILVAPRG